VFVGFAVYLLGIPYLKIVGGLLLLWIGVRLLLPEADAADKIQPATRLLGAIKTIVVADVVMSIDNVIAIAGAANAAEASQRMLLIGFGLVVSIPLVVWGSQLVLKLIDRFPLVVVAGGGLLGWIGGGLIVGDIALSRWPSLAEPDAHWIAALAGAVVVVLLGLGLKHRHSLQVTQK